MIFRSLVLGAGTKLTTASTVVTADALVRLSKTVRVPLECDVAVPRCGRVLNCWNAFVNHQVVEHWHRDIHNLDYRVLPTPSPCYPRRADPDGATATPTVAEWRSHIEQKHPLPCPLEDCASDGDLPRDDPAKAVRPEAILFSHILTHHSGVLGRSFASVDLKPQASPFTAAIDSEPPPALPRSVDVSSVDCIPHIGAVTVTVRAPCPARRGASATFSQLLADRTAPIPPSHLPHPAPHARLAKWPAIAGSVGTNKSLSLFHTPNIEEDGDMAALLDAESFDDLEGRLIAEEDMLGTPYLWVQPRYADFGGVYVDVVRPCSERGSVSSAVH